jgi:hypothetical protein
MSAILPANAILVDQLEIGLVHQGGRLKTVIRRLLPEVAGSQPTEIIVEKVHEAVGRDGSQEPCCAGLQQDLCELRLALALH